MNLTLHIHIPPTCVLEAKRKYEDYNWSAIPPLQYPHIHCAISELISECLRGGRKFAESNTLQKAAVFPRDPKGRLKERVKGDCGEKRRMRRDPWARGSHAFDRPSRSLLSLSFSLSSPLAGYLFHIWFNFFIIQFLHLYKAQTVSFLDGDNFPQNHE